MSEKNKFDGALIIELPDEKEGRTRRVKELSTDELRDFQKNYGNYGYRQLAKDEKPEVGDFVIDADDYDPLAISLISGFDDNGNELIDYTRSGVAYEGQENNGGNKVYYRFGSAEVPHDKKELGATEKKDLGGLTGLAKTLDVLAKFAKRR